MKPTDLDALQAFALVGPGFTGAGWWLLTPNPSAHTYLWFAPYESHGAHAFKVPVHSAPVDLDFLPDVPRPRWDLDSQDYTSKVDAVRQAIAAGDVYQVNLTLRARVDCSLGSTLLTALCARGTPPFAAWVKLPGWGEFVSGSPELLFSLSGLSLCAQPMKGTAPPGQSDWLAHSDKDKAELAMITDLTRNDLHRLCLKGSVRVVNAQRFIHLPYAVQAVSDVEGTLEPGLDLADVLAQFHPGGSVTGAPRKAAQALISTLEDTPRGAYCGTLGLQSNGVARFSLLIRTAQRVDEGHFVFGVGGGITWDSNAASELAEVHTKMGALS